jgi:dinuclear metal center YbgI/SA1388 family protein
VAALAEVLRALRTIASLELAEEWDNVGLLVEPRADVITRVMTALTITGEVARDCLKSKVDLVVSHHPVMFKPIRKMTYSSADGAVLLPLIAAGVGVYSAHTAYDNAAGGVNEQLAVLFGLNGVTGLRRPAARPTWSQVKLVTTVPVEHRERVQRAVWGAGAGGIGAYRECSFYSDGTGTFRGEEGANPAYGEAGRFEMVAESRLETICPARALAGVLAALRGSHPYEEPAIDIIPLLDPEPPLGTGRMGELPQPMRGGEFANLVSQRLGIMGVMAAGEIDKPIKRVGIACGAAGEFLKDAIGAGCDAFVTGEARYHDCVAAREAGVLCVVAGHDATERFAMKRLAEQIQLALPDTECWASRCEQDPLSWVAVE